MDFEINAMTALRAIRKTHRFLMWWSLGWACYSLGFVIIRLAQRRYWGWGGNALWFLYWVIIDLLLMRWNMRAAAKIDVGRRPDDPGY